MLVLYDSISGGTVKFYVTKSDSGVNALKALIGETLKESPTKESLMLPDSFEINLCEKVTELVSRRERKVIYRPVETIILPKGLEIKLFVKDCDTHGKSNGVRDAMRAGVPEVCITRCVEGKHLMEYFGLHFDFQSNEIKKFAIPSRNFLANAS